MLSLTDFLNHGLLPFVGRSAEIEALMQFWRSSIDVGGLRIAVITAEAGAGKTRLLDQLLPRIAREGGMVVRARLYPDSSASIAPLMAQALGKSGIAFRLLKVAPAGTMAEVVATFRRVARLRPVVLMIENFRSRLIWRLMREDEDLRRGLHRAGFTGGWLLADEGARA